MATELPADPTSREVLLECDCFRTLRARLLDQVFAAARERRYEPEEIVIHQGLGGDALFVMIEGEARVQVRDHDGTVRTIATLGRASVAGEMSLITQEPATADVVATTEIRVLVLSAAEFDALTAKNPELTIVLTNLVADRLGRALHDGLGGKVLNGYRVLGTAGRGGMAVVYEAKELATGEHVALKMMSHRLVYQPGAASRFEREARIVEHLEHENIARMKGHFPAFRTEFIVMELCEGATLGDLLSRHGAFPERETKRILGQLATALQFVHDHGVVHRDLKPGNVMLTPEGRVKLMDFGLAKEDENVSGDTATHADTVLGTPLYMPPGQMTGEESGPAIDIYAFACIAYELVAGKPLHEGRTARGLFQDKLTRRVPPAEQIGPGVSEDFHALLAKGLENEPKDRLDTLASIVPWGGEIDRAFLEELFSVTVLAALAAAALRFGWPESGDAIVELTDERTVGDSSRTIVLTMRLHVEPDRAADRLVVRLEDAQLVSLDGASASDADPQHTLLAVGRVMKSLTPTMVVGRDGSFLETRDADRMLVNVLQAAGFPAPPPVLDSFKHLLNDVAAEDWSAWVGAWIGNGLAPGESSQVVREMNLRGTRVPLRVTRRGLPPLAPHGHTRIEAQAVYPSEAVKNYTAGFLVDLAREAKELDDHNPDLSARFLRSAQYGPMTQTLTVEVETETMRPHFAERLREFTASKGRHKVEGRERRTHRFTWAAGVAP